MIRMTLGRFRSFSGAVGAALALSLLLSACGGQLGGGGSGSNGGKVAAKDKSAFKEGSTMANIKKRGKLNVGISFDLPPFTSENSVTGSPEGFDVDLVKWIATGIFGTNIEGKINYIELDPRERELALDQNKVDIVVGRYDVSAARKRFVDFAGPYYTTHQALLVLSHPVDRSKQIGSFLQLTGKKVCIVRGSTDVEALTGKLPNVDVSLQRSTVADCGTELINGNVSAIAADSVDVTPFLSLAGRDVSVLAANYGALPYGVGVKKGVSDMREFLNNRIAGWKSYGASTDRWLSGVPGGNAQPTVDRY